MKFRRSKVNKWTGIQKASSQWWSSSYRSNNMYHWPVYSCSYFWDTWFSDGNWYCSLWNFEFCPDSVQKDATLTQPAVSLTPENADVKRIVEATLFSPNQQSCLVYKNCQKTFVTRNSRILECSQIWPWTDWYQKYIRKNWFF